MNIQARRHLCKIDTLCSTSKAILLTLITYCHGDKDSCYPSTGDIAKMSGYAKRTIRKHLRILEEKDFVKTTKEKERKTHRYKILGLNSGRMDSGTEFLQSSNPEGLQENTYEPTGGRFDGRKPPKASDVCDLRLSKPKNRKQNPSVAPSEPTPQLPAGYANPLHPQSTAPSVAPSEPTPQLPAGYANPLHPQSTAPSVAPSEPTPQLPAGYANPLHPQSTAPSVAPSVRFEGQLTTQKIVELYNLYTRHGWIKRCYDSFFNFVANCLMIKRLRKRNVYGYLTWVYKKKFDRKLITAKDEELAKKELKLIQDNGLMPYLMEAQPLLRRDPEAPVPPPPPPTARLSTSRPAMDWPERNLPETGKEAALAKKVEHRQVTHVNPKWLESLNCWMVKVRKVDGRRFYEEQDLTHDGWFEVTGMTEIVPLISGENRRVSQASFVEMLTSGFFAPDPTLPAK